MAWITRPGVFIAQIEDDLIFLDLDADAYSCIPCDPGDAVLADDHLLISATGLTMVLEAAGLIQQLDDAAERRQRPRTPRPVADLIDPQASRPRLAFRHLALMLGAWWDVCTQYYGRPVSSLVRTVTRERKTVPTKPASPAQAAEVLRLAQAFSTLLPWIPFQGECLFQAFMLVRFLQRAGLQADWVFGVRTWPFHAHCWVQLGELVLNDAADRLTAFTPIMVA